MSNQVINNKLNYLKYENNEITFTPTDFVTQANNRYFNIEEGYIEDLFVVNDTVFATIRKDEGGIVDPSGNMVSHGDSLFNGADGVDKENMTLAELAIPTNIDASNNKLERYIGKRANVTIKNDVAVSADVKLGEKQLTSYPVELLKKIRIAIAGKTDDLFSKLGREYLTSEGFSDEEIEDLRKLKYNSEMEGKINTFEGDAYWFKDTVKKQLKENVLEDNPIIKGLNKLGMKTRECHKPSTIFSGK